MRRLSLDLHEPLLADFCRRWKVSELALFGSALRDDFKPESNVDVLVAFAPDAHWSLLCPRLSKLDTNRPQRAEKNEAPSPAAFTQGGRLPSSRQSQLSPEGFEFLHGDGIQIPLRK
jgi:hypothetical protein